MRQILILLALTCAPAFCQDSTVSVQPDKTIELHFLPPPEKLCSIPLLNARSAGNPVHMPTLRMPQGARGASGATGARTEPQVFDRMAVKPPAPACPAR